MSSDSVRHKTSCCNACAWIEGLALCRRERHCRHQHNTVCVCVCAHIAMPPIFRDSPSVCTSSLQRPLPVCPLAALAPPAVAAPALRG